jgi:hypothetical protein
VGLLSLASISNLSLNCNNALYDNFKMLRMLILNDKDFNNQCDLQFVYLFHSSESATCVHRSALCQGICLCVYQTV